MLEAHSPCAELVMLGVSTDHCELATRNSELETFFGRRSAAPEILFTGNPRLAKPRLGLKYIRPDESGLVEYYARKY
jgi:hypothetical protein